MRQLEFWNDYAGPSWAEHARAFDGLTDPLGPPVEVCPGDRVLDVGCGTGGSTAVLAERAGPSGAVVGVDLSAPMLATARERCAGFDQVSFVRCDVGAFVADRPFDLAYSRMCLQFLEHPVPDLRAVHDALRPRGRLTASFFRGMADNPWLPAVVLGAAPHVGPVPPLPLPGEPGPFAWADHEHVTGLLDAAGFTDVRVEALDPVLRPAGRPDEIAEALIALGPAGGAYRGAPEAARSAARAGVSALLDRFHGALPSGIWVITARRPA